MDLKTWARYASFLILSKSYQADHLHNVRIAIDPWSGYVIPILQDPHPVNIDQKIYTLEYSKDDLLALLNRSSIFIDKKYDSLFNFVVNSKVLSKEVDYFNEVKDQFSISLKRDPEINFKEMPFLYNPDRGYIATANNKIVDDDYPYYISNQWAEPSRIERIEEWLDSKEAWPPDLSQAPVELPALTVGVWPDMSGTYPSYQLPEQVEAGTTVDFVDPSVLLAVAQWHKTVALK